MAYTIIKKYVEFDFDSEGETIVTYEISELCTNSEFKNAVFEAIKTREYILHMVTTLSQKLDIMSQMLAAEKTEN